MRPTKSRSTRPPFPKLAPPALPGLVGLLSLAILAAAPARAGDPPPMKAARTGNTFEVMESKNILYRGMERGEIIPFGNTLDLYLPKGAKHFPVLLLVHGGAWVVGDKRLDFIPEIARCFARQGIGVVVPNYRLGPLFQHPAHMQDVAKAFAWTHKHIPQYGGCADQIFVLGHSAGGHLVSLLATDESYLNQEGLNRRDIAGVIAISGVYQISNLTLNLRLEHSLITVNAAVTANPFTLVFGKSAEQWERASPLTHVRAGLPPFLVIYAEDELPSLEEMAKKFHAALSNNKCEAQLVKVVQRNHFTVLWQASKVNDPVACLVREFMEMYAVCPHLNNRKE
jgi:acetyl esterase/lipase